MNHPEHLSRLSDPFLFVGGCPRSGTTLLQRILDHHPQLTIANDTHFIPRVLETISPRAYESACAGKEIPLTDELCDAVWNYHRFYRMEIDHETFWFIATKCATYAELIRGLFDTRARAHVATMAGEKTPDYIRHVGLLLGMFSTSRFIHIIRDGRDTALSLLQWATETKGPGRFVWWERDPIAVSALWWKQFVTSPTSYPGAPNRLQTIHYEAILDQPEFHVRNICDWLEIEFDDGMLQFHRGKLRATSGSAKQRWLPVTKGLRDWRESMKSEDVATFELLAGDALSQFGYPLSDHRPNQTANDRAHLALQWWNHRDEQRMSRPATLKVRSHNRMVVSDRCCQPLDVLHGEDALPTEVPEDRQLPTFRNLFDPILIEQVLREHGCLTADQKTNGVQPRYVRYKPARNCLVGYADETGAPWGFLVAHRSDASDKYSNAARFLDSWNSPQHDRGDDRSCQSAPIGFVDVNRHMVGFRFPFDPRLSSLAETVTALQQRQVPPIFAKLLPQFEGVGSYRVLSYKPQRRCVMQFCDRKGQSAVIRFYTQRDYAEAQRAHKHLSSSNWAVARRLGASDSHQIVAMQWLEGTPLLDCARERNESLAAAGQFLAALHTTIHPKLTLLSSDTMLERMHRSTQSLCELLPTLQSRASRLAEQCGRALPPSIERPVVTHGDFHPAQLLWTHQGIAAVDWDRAQNGPPIVDIGAFAAHLILGSLRGGNSTAESRRGEVEAFLDGYRAAGGREPVGYRAAIVASILQISMQPFRQQSASWLAVTHALLDEAERWLPSRETERRRRPSLDSPCFPPRYHDRSRVAPSIQPEGQVGLRAAFDTEMVAPTLEFLVDSLQGETATRWQLVDIKTLRHVKNRRDVIEYSFRPKSAGDDASVPHFAIIGKVRKKGLDLIAFESQCRLYDAVGTPHDARSELRVARPLGVVPQWSLWLQSRLPGTSADTLLTPNGNPELAARIGRALATLHMANVPAVRQHSFADELSILTSGLTRVAELRSEWADAIDEVGRACKDALAMIPSGIETGIHRDFYPAQVLVDDDSIGIVDCDLWAAGHPAIDVGNFVAHLQEAALRQAGDPRAFRKLEHAFVTAYVDSYDTPQGADASGVSLRAIDILTFVSFARHIVISQRIEDRRSLTASIIEYCHQMATTILPNFRMRGLSCIRVG